MKVLFTITITLNHNDQTAMSDDTPTPSVIGAEIVRWAQVSRVGSAEGPKYSWSGP